MSELFSFSEIYFCAVGFLNLVLTKNNYINSLLLVHVGDKGIDNRCGWTGKLQDLTRHRETCPFQQVQCSYENCTEMVQRREIEEHKRTCKFRLVVCKCRVTLFQTDLANHIENYCPITVVPCPKSCTYTTPGYDVKQIRR
jgi:hypothetical protein